jgi:hypothetical protein
MIEFFQWLQATPWSTWLRESTWSYPILAAIHVLGIAWFGGAVLKDLPAGKRMGLGFMTVTGAILFYMAPVHCYQSYAFRAKMLLLVAAGVETWRTHSCVPCRDSSRHLSPASSQPEASPRVATRHARVRAPLLSLACWIGMIFAGRGIAFF